MRWLAVAAFVLLTCTADAQLAVSPIAPGVVVNGQPAGTFSYPPTSGSGPPAPTNTVPPTISGLTPAPSTLTTTNGTWTGSPSFTYAWRRDGVNIGGATAFTYTTVDPTDVGHVITSAVTGTNAGGNATAGSSNSITPTSGGGGCSNTLDFSQACNSQYISVVTR